MFEGSSHPLRLLLRHTASVPKGFLRYVVLRLLEEKPMSGSEIMEKIAEQTAGRWKPSPGSIYPLLAWLQDNGYTKEVQPEESGTRRYTLSEKGKDFFKEQVKLKEKMQERLEFFAPPFLSVFWLTSHPEKVQEIQEPLSRFIRSVFNLRMALEKNPTDQAVREAGKVLSASAAKIEELSTRIKETNETFGINVSKVTADE